MLHTEPSFSIYSSDDKFGEEAENEELIKQKLAEIKRTATIGESIESQFSFGPNAMRIIEEADGDEDDDDDEGEEKDRASNGFKDFKIEPAVGGDGVEFAPFDSDHDKYYTKMVCQDPSNPLVLRNYAQYLEVGFCLFHTLFPESGYVRYKCLREFNNFYQFQRICY